MTGGKYALRRSLEAPKRRSAVDDPPLYRAAVAQPAPRCGRMVGGKHALRRMLAREVMPRG
jgi:hypothetical protein